MLKIDVEVKLRLARWDFADWMKRNELLAAAVDSAQAYTNEFLPGEGLGSESTP